MEITEDRLLDLKAMQKFCLNKSRHYSGLAGLDFGVMEHYLDLFINEIQGKDHSWVFNPSEPESN